MPLAEKTNICALLLPFTITLAANAMECDYAALKIPFFDGEIQLTDTIGFGSKNLIEIIERKTGIKCDYNEPLVAIKALIPKPQEKNAYFVWTQEIPPCIQKPITKIARQRLAEETKQLDCNSRNSKGWMLRKERLAEIAAQKRESFLFPPALPARSLDTSSVITIRNGFGGPINCKLTFDEHQNLDRLYSSLKNPSPTIIPTQRELALDNHGIKRPLDLVTGRQHGPLSKKQRLLTH